MMPKSAFEGTILLLLLADELVSLLQDPYNDIKYPEVSGSVKANSQDGRKNPPNTFL